VSKRLYGVYKKRSAAHHKALSAWVKAKKNHHASHKKLMYLTKRHAAAAKAVKIAKAKMHKARQIEAAWKKKKDG